MRISIDKNLVEFCPESADEKTKIETIWRMLVDCNGEARRLVPVGEYVPGKNANGATFYIEGLEAKEQVYTEIRVDADCKCYCAICNKLINLDMGDPIPLCCGQLMEIID